MKQAEIEKKILDFWKKDTTFEKSLKKDAPKGDYVFYDGPPFATGTPHYGHIVASLIKDMVPRYFTMRGYRVPRTWGWDCHGLPIENIVEKEHGFKHKKDILAFGVDKFNEEARSKVLLYVSEWREVIDRMGRWVDFDNDYKTMDPQFMESVWWVFKELYDKGLLYEAYRSMHICPRCETTLAQSEVAQGYQDVTDLSVVAKFKIKNPHKLQIQNKSTNSNLSSRGLNKHTKKSESGNLEAGQLTDIEAGREDPAESSIYLLAWTTTPWTLPGNAALAVGEDIEYVLIAVNNQTPSAAADKHQENTNNQNPNEYLVLAKVIFERWIAEKKFEGAVIKTIKGKDLIGLEYEPLFPYYDNYTAKKPEPSPSSFAKAAADRQPSPLKGEGDEWQNAFKVYTADFVNTDEGTGIVHIAPAFGTDDYELSKKEHIPFIQHVHMDGTFNLPVEKHQTPSAAADKHQENTNNQKAEEILKKLQGMYVKHQDKPNSTAHDESKIESVDVLIVKYLSYCGLLFDKQKIKHSYPHCWRCDSPLLNYATSSWFVAVEKIKDDLLKNAEHIQWMPEHMKDGRFGQWLSGARDWSISRQRFWGSVLPIWKCVSVSPPAKGEMAKGQRGLRKQSKDVTSPSPSLAGGEGCGHRVVIGSIAELEKLSNKKITDLHKHFVDEITFPCSECAGTMQRIPDVLDCWFESGSMPYGQMHYPFENEDTFKNNFPAEFIAEGVDQTRAWFYYLHVLATALKKKPAFKHVIVNGIVLAEDGKKMSKRLKNYPDPMDMFNKYGADAVRYYLATAPVLRAEDFCFSEKGVDEVVKKVLLILYNVLAFYKMYEQKEKGKRKKEKSVSHVLDQWIVAKLNQLVAEVTIAYDAYDLNKASRPIAGFVNELSTWYVRRSRDRFKGDDEKDKAEALATLQYVLETLALVMAPVMPFTAEHVWQELRNNQTPNTKHQIQNRSSVHLEVWPKAGKVDANVLEKMEAVRKIVELGLAERAKQGIKIRQPLNSISITLSIDRLTDDFEQLIKDELNVKKIQYNFVKEVNTGISLSSGVVFDTVLTDELRAEGNLRELVRIINGMRKKAGLAPGDKITLLYETESDALKKVFEKDVDKLKAMVAAVEIQAIKKAGGGKVQEMKKILDNEMIQLQETIDANGEKVKIEIQKQ